ncbi:class I SAM-dependent methyltransferase [Rhodococcus artemisiae]|uniref:Class I SAM-dependent methyltransferase n=1 Tax=Rhodococcus artemisiae TaxID=714159 RepID=A0ABU7L3I3_9NOCA|nr:class I SAM-dependent methyltransferase [Rhodococcus artemisiae]MEE2056116.1 class I SAM-dependent methyltransferase [Rhodococcus artemisiae]
MTDSTTPTTDHALKAKHRAMWALGDYPAVADTVIPTLGARLVAATGVQTGDRVLDIAAGSGNASIPAALAGGDVTAGDLTPELFEVGRRHAAAAGARLDWTQTDAEALPFDTGAFDTVLSCVGIMFAPHHQAAADELVRVTRPGGRIGLLAWTPTGFIGEMFATMKPYAPPPPPGAQPPPLWGDETHVHGLLGDRVRDIDTRTETVRVDAFGTAAEFRDFFKQNYGPTVAVYASLTDTPDRAAALDRDLDDLARRYDLGRGTMDWEYLLLTARRS